MTPPTDPKKRSTGDSGAITGHCRGEVRGPFADAFEPFASIAVLESENARLQMELDCACNAEEFRQTREENARLRKWIEELDEIAKCTTPARDWHGDIGWLYPGQAAYVGESRDSFSEPQRSPMLAGRI